MSITSRIKDLCNKENITFTELEKRVNIYRGSIARFEKSAPSSDKITKIAKYFNVTTDYLLELTDNPFPQKTEDVDIISLQRARQNMTTKDRKKMMEMLKVAFDYAFDDSKGDDENK